MDGDALTLKIVHSKILFRPKIYSFCILFECYFVYNLGRNLVECMKFLLELMSLNPYTLHSNLAPLPPQPINHIYRMTKQ
jgi:hypothetical protein